MKSMIYSEQVESEEDLVADIIEASEIIRHANIPKNTTVIAPLL